MTRSFTGFLVVATVVSVLQLALLSTSRYDLDILGMDRSPNIPPKSYNGSSHDKEGEAKITGQNRTTTKRAFEEVKSTAPSVQNTATKPDRRPWLLVHIGPHKTGTSTIQCELSFLKEYLRNRSSTEYIGRVYRSCLSDPTAHVSNTIDTRSLVRCLDQHSDSSPCSDREEWIEFARLLEKLAANQTNVIMSDEAISRAKLTDSNLRLFNATVSEHFRVKLVVVYRRYWEWLLSMHNEKYKPRSYRKRFRIWPDEQGGESMESFPVYYRRLLQWQGFGGYQMAAERQDVHAAYYLKEQFRRHFDDVRIFNMHQQTGTLLDNFVQTIVPDLQGAYAKRTSHRDTHHNPSANLDYDLLATAARKRGLLRYSLQRRHVTHAVAGILGSFSYSNQTTTTIGGAVPLECLTDTERATLLNRSLALERHMFPKDADDWVEPHQAAFAEANFCNVDTDQALADPVWQQFFQSL